MPSFNNAIWNKLFNLNTYRIEQSFQFVIMSIQSGFCLFLWNGHPYCKDSETRQEPKKQDKHKQAGKSKSKFTSVNQIGHKSNKRQGRGSSNCRPGREQNAGKLGRCILDNLAKPEWRWTTIYTARLIREMGSRWVSGLGGQVRGMVGKGVTAGQEGVAGSVMTGRDSMTGKHRAGKLMND